MTQTLVNTLLKVHNEHVDYELRTEIHQGRSHLVVPVVMMVEGVHSGSAGPILHLAEELGRVPGSWNGMPVVVQHPVRDGRNVSANDPAVLQEEKVGRVFNTRMEGQRLLAEAWIDEQRLTDISIAALEAIQGHQPLDVSVGVFTEEEQVEGDWNGENYISIARNHRPDHLALLPGGQGACSWNDGCGIRVNNKKEGGTMTKNKDDPSKGIELAVQLNSDARPAFSDLKTLKGKGVVIHSLITDEMGKRTLVENMQRKLDMMDTDSRVHFLEEVYDDYFVYRVSIRDGDTTFYRRDFEVNENEEIEFSTDYTEVRKNVEFVNINNMKRTKFNNNSKKEDADMKTAKDGCNTCKEKVDALIANEASALSKDDREWLETLEEERLDKLTPKPVEAPQANASEKKGDGADKDEPKLTLKDVATPEEYETFVYGAREIKANKDRMIEGITTNAEGVWTKEELEAMSIDQLTKVYKTIPHKEEEGTVDYSGQGGSRTRVQTNEEPVLAPPGVTSKSDDNK